MLGLKRDMFDCMEALGLAPRPLYDVSGQGSCMLAKATPYFSGLDPFAWAGTSSIQCEYSVCESVCSYQSPVLLSCSSICRKSQIPFNSMCPFSPCILFVYVLSVLCGAE